MRKSNFFFLFILVISACSRKTGPENLYSQLKKESHPHKVLTRALADTGTGVNKCLKDIFTVDVVKAEIVELEKKYEAGTKVVGTWKHLNLEELPIPQANFLKTYGDQIGDLSNPLAFDYSDCKDVPCIFNKIYGKENNVAGYVHYLWYLKMGNLLAAGNVSYEFKDMNKPGVYNGKTFPVSAYLFKDSEIYSFWRLLHMLKPAHIGMADFTQIQRLPQGESFESTMAQRKLLEQQNAARKLEGKPPLKLAGETCGRAFSTGYVALQDICLTVDALTWDRGTFYQSVLHEFSHILDYAEGEKIGKQYRSQEKDYLAVSGFVLEEYKDETGVTHREFTQKPEIKNVRKYAGVSPAENFADTISYFRIYGKETKITIAADHWNLISSTYFDSKGFEPKDLFTEWIIKNYSTISQDTLKSVSECFGNPAPTASNYLKASDFSVALLPSVLNCLGTKAKTMSLDLQASIKVTEPEGCSFLNSESFNTDWDGLFKAQVIGLMNGQLKQLIGEQPQYAEIKIFIDDIGNTDMAVEAYLSCRESDRPESCYQEEVKKLANNKLAALSIVSKQAEELSLAYLSSHPFDLTRDYLLETYRAFLNSKLSLIETKASEKWNLCSTDKVSDVKAPSGKFFTISEGYLVSSIYNCINVEFPNVASELVQEMTSDHALHPQEEEILLEEIVPKLQEVFKKLYVDKRKAEEKAVATFVANNKTQTRKTLLVDLSWLKGVPVANTQKTCQKQALSKVTMKLRYHTKAESFGAFAVTVCKDLQSTPEYKAWKLKN